MTCILAIDAAWTTTEPSGVALVSSNGTNWRCRAVAPSYDAFIALSRGERIDWSSVSFPGGVADAATLLAAAHRILGVDVDLITIDMPVAMVPIAGRRAADDVVSAQFGGRWCSTHTPNSSCPGALGSELSNAFRDCGYPLLTLASTTRNTPCLIEVYPHPALLSLMVRPRRVPYKVSKTNRYWPDCTKMQRIEALLGEFAGIHRALDFAMGRLGLPLPRADAVETLTYLKRYEDALDALVCAWVGIQFFLDRTVSLGDATAAIWCPSDVVR